MLQPADMKGRVALVTGAASGLGRATALTLAKAGADLFIADVNAAGLEATAAQARELGVRTECLAGNLSDPEICKDAVARAVASFGRLDALCNVAGIIVFAHSTDLAVADWNRTLAINLSGPFFLMQAAIPHLLETAGAIVNVTSTAAFVGEAYATSYCASKAGLTQLTKALAMEYIHQPIRINAVAPGGMATNISTNIAFPENADFTLVQRYSGLRGLVEVDEVAAMIAYLASPAAQGYHGACINIDRGITAG